MSIHDYLEKQRNRPERERWRLAYIWTAIAFSIVVVIWAVSFREMNKPVETPADQPSANLNDLKTDFQDGKDSIQNMMQDLPASSVGGPSQTIPSGTENIQEGTSVPQLP